MEMLGNQHQRHGDHHFVSHRVKESTKTRSLLPAAGQIAVEPVSDRRKDENQCTSRRCPCIRQIESQHEKRNEYNAKQGEACRYIKLHGVGNCLSCEVIMSMLLHRP